MNTNTNTNSNANTNTNSLILIQIQILIEKLILIIMLILILIWVLRPILRLKISISIEMFNLTRCVQSQWVPPGAHIVCVYTYKCIQGQVGPSISYKVQPIHEIYIYLYIYIYKSMHVQKNLICIDSFCTITTPYFETFLNTFFQCHLASQQWSMKTYKVRVCTLIICIYI